MSTTGAKPFSLQSPEAIAKQYEGNKQKIAQAIQLGLVDATAGTLAGMFIDRMRSAAIQEQGPPQTVAQQVLGSGPAVPPPGGPPMAQQAGGSPPPPMPAPQGAPPASSAAPMGGPPVRAADGGLMSLPVPDAMFDELEDTSMARGGLVAFAEGRSVGDEAAPFEAPEQEDTDWSFGATMGRLGDRIGSGLSAWNEAAQETRKKQAQEGVVYKNGKYYSSLGFGVRPAPNTRVLDASTGKYFKVPGFDPRAGGARAPNSSAASRGPMTGMQPTPEQLAESKARLGALRDTPPARGLGGTREALSNPAMFSAQQAGPKHAEQIKNAADQAAGKPTIEGQSKDPIADAIAKYAGYLEDPEYKAYMEGEKTKLSKQKKEDVWSTLAQIGFGMAASKSPTLLGAIGEAGTAAVPNIQKALQGRRAAEADYAKQRMETRRAAVTGGIGIQQNAEQVGLKREEMSQKERQFEAELDAAWKRAQLQAGAQIAGARINAAAAERETDFKFAVRSLANSLFKSNPQKYPTIEAAQAAAIREYVGDLRQKQPGDTSIADALAGAGAGNRNGYNPNAVREKQ